MWKQIEYFVRENGVYYTEISYIGAEKSERKERKGEQRNSPDINTVENSLRPLGSKIKDTMYSESR